jgi:uncharacterized membrane protein YtjA (UPF0391 family)
MRDLPIENVDDETFETWRAHPATEALVHSIAKLRGRLVIALTNVALGGGGTTATTATIADLGGQIRQCDQVVSLLTGETREKKDASKESR